ncbi:NADP-dependent oxidoreductase [Streptomyces gamaensis]|uniref:NADP-dependent oxidoreductase n=1 Tax=Streptomyces gamaensis TaxID=1763542 RepID=A0ABW0YYL8_9ACTN
MPQAIRYASYGDADVLRLTEVPMPEPGPGQVRVEVRATTVNPFDWKLRSGLIARGEPLAGPAGTGTELAGTVDALGPGVEEAWLGRAVFGRSANRSAAAEYDLALVDELLPKPESLSYAEAAALPIAVETAGRGLAELGVEAGQTLLVHAAAGGVGLTAVQLAVARRIKVVGTASEANHGFLRELGAVPVTYGEGWPDRVRAAAPQGVDAVLDCSGRGVLAESVELTGSPEKVLTIADPRASEHKVRFSATAGPVREALAAALPLIEEGRLRMPVARVFSLAETADAHRLSEAGHVRGKVVITTGAGER